MLCNYCQYQGLLRKAQTMTKVPRIVTVKKAVYAFGGVDVYIHGKNVTPTDKHFVMWFMELPSTCQC